MAVWPVELTLSLTMDRLFNATSQSQDSIYLIRWCCAPWTCLSP